MPGERPTGRRWLDVAAELERQPSRARFAELAEKLAQEIQRELDENERAPKSPGPIPITMPVLMQMLPSRAETQTESPFPPLSVDYPQRPAGYLQLADNALHRRRQRTLKHG